MARPASRPSDYLFGALVGFAVALSPASAQAGERRDRALAQFDAVFSGEESSDCGTGALSSVHAAWDALSPEDRHRVELASSPLYRSAVLAGEPSWLDGAQTRTACLLPEDIAGFASYEEAATSEHFVVFRQSGAAPMAETVSETLALLEQGLSSFGERGWREPAGLDSFQMMVFLDARPPTLGGYTWVSPCDDVPGGFVDWLVLNEDWARDDERAASLVAHELFHTIQRRYAWDELVTGWEESGARWFAEASAVYEESLVFPQRTALTAARSGLWSEQPWVALETFDGRREYESFVLLLAVEAALETRAWHQALWESVDGRTGWSPLDELGAQAGEIGFDGLFAEYLARASEMDLPRVDYLVGPRDLDAFNGVDGGMAARYTAVELPVSGAMEAGDPRGPQERGANYVWFGTTDAEPDQALRLDVQLDPQAPGGEPVQWALEVVAARAGALVDRLSVQVAPGDDARVLVHGARGVDGVWLIASPVTASSAGPPGWSWSARLTRGESALRLEQTAGGCGCAVNSGVSPLSPLSAFVLLGLLVAGRRRRWAT